MLLQMYYNRKGKKGIEDILKKMRELILETDIKDKDRIIKSTARKIIKNIDPKNWKGQLKAIFRWVKSNVKYVRDIHGIEELTRPDILLKSVLEGKEIHSSDCDDIAMLLAAMLRSIGFKVRLEAIALKSNKYNHARVAVQNPDNKRWIVLEGTSKKARVGFRFPSKLPVMYVIV